MAALAHHPEEARQLRLGHAGQLVALRVEVHGEENGDVVEERRNSCPQRHLRVGHRQEFRHHERRGAHDRRHDLPASRRDGFHRGRERRAKAGALHQRNRDRAVDHHVGDRAAGYRAEQRRGHDRDLARSTRRVTGERHRKVHEELAGAAALHERAEQHEQHDVTGGHAERRAEDAFGGEIQLLHQDLGRDTGEADGVDQERDRGQRQGETDHAPRRLEHDRHRDHRIELVQRGQIVDVDDAVDEVVVVEKDVQDEAIAQGQQEEIRGAPGGRTVRPQRIEQEHQRQREQQMRAAEDDRLGRAERRHVHVIKRHSHRDRADEPAQRRARRRGRLRLFGDDDSRRRLGHRSLLCGAAG